MLKPTVQKKKWSPISKGGQPHPSMPVSSPATAARYPAMLIKTPRPDIMVGFGHDVFCKAFEKHGIAPAQVADFLESYQESGWLPPEATQSYLGMRMPFLVVEGKSFATGGHILDAQNQGMVGVASLGLLLRKLDNLVPKNSSPQSRGEESSGTESYQDHRASSFLICTQGPSLTSSFGRIPCRSTTEF